MKKHRVQRGLFTIEGIKDDALVRRAYAAWFRTAATGGLFPVQPCASRSDVAHHNGRLYVCLRNASGLLKAYRVRNDGRLKGLRRPPAAVVGA